MNSLRTAVIDDHEFTLPPYLYRSDNGWIVRRKTGTPNNRKYFNDSTYVSTEISYLAALKFLHSDKRVRPVLGVSIRGHTLHRNNCHSTGIRGVTLQINKQKQSINVSACLGRGVYKRFHAGIIGSTLTELKFKRALDNACKWRHKHECTVVDNPPVATNGQKRIVIDQMKHYFKE